MNTSIAEGAVARTRERFAVNQAGEIEQRPRSSKRWNLIDLSLIRYRQVFGSVDHNANPPDLSATRERILGIGKSPVIAA